MMRDTMATTTSKAHTENYELRYRKASAISDIGSSNVRPTTKESHNQQESISADSSSRKQFDRSSFRSLIATNKNAVDIVLASSESPSTPLFYIANGSWKRKTPSVVVSYSEKSGPVLGTLKLGWGRDNTFGLGDPAKGEPITWENMRRVSEWTHSDYEFSYGQHSDKQGRRTFIWRRTKQGFISDQPNMELREKTATGEIGDVVGVYEGIQGFMWNDRGNFWLSPILHNESGTAWEGSTAGSWSDLELLALLTGLGIIEASRRRARSRRGR